MKSENELSTFGTENHNKRKIKEIASQKQPKRKKPCLNNLAGPSDPLHRKHFPQKTIKVLKTKDTEENSQSKKAYYIQRNK